VALALHWHPRGGASGAGQVVAALVLGSAGCAGVGLLLAGRLHAEVNLAAANGLYLVLLLISGIVVPLSSLPSALGRLALYLPPGAMAQAVHQVLGQGTAAGASLWWTLVVWAVAAPLLAARSFRFD